MIERYKDALEYSVMCFKSRAMTMTSDQLKSEIDDILKGHIVYQRIRDQVGRVVEHHDLKQFSTLKVK